MMSRSYFAAAPSSALRRYWRFPVRSVSAGGLGDEGHFGYQIGRLVRGNSLAALPALMALADGPAATGILLAWRHFKGALRPRAQGVLELASVQAFFGFNAYESAYQLGRDLETKAAQIGLPVDAQATLNSLLARAAMRSGRAEEGRDRYHVQLQRTPRTQNLLNWILANHNHRPDFAADLAEQLLDERTDISARWLCFLAEILLRSSCEARALSTIRLALSKAPSDPDPYLAMANYCLATDDPDGWEQAMRGQARCGGISFDRIRRSKAPAIFWFDCDREVRHEGPLVTVIMTAYNSAPTVSLAIKSVLDQSHANLELIVIDDGSTDETINLIKQAAARDQRLVLLQSPSNLGTYAGKNRGIAVGRGAYVTFHDSDDWMHPERVAAHVHCMSQMPSIICSVSNWMRMNANGKVTPRSGSSFAHHNPASTFVRRQAFDRLGGFDEFRTGADTEFLARLKLEYGPDAVVRIRDCLTLGLTHDSSLTTAGPAAFDENRYSPVRLSYTESWLSWHLQTVEVGASLGIKPGRPRPFPLLQMPLEEIKVSDLS